MSNATPPPTHHLGTVALSVQPSEFERLPEGCNVQLFPDGKFTARDGRPGSLPDCETTTWFMDAYIAGALIDQVDARETPLFVDYEHHTLTAKERGHTAIAAGWVEGLLYVPGRGLFANVAWTDAARQHIQADEYRYISPLFGFDLKTGAVRTLINAALTNNPALDGLPAVAAALEIEKEILMGKDKDEGVAALSEELLTQLRWMLNLPVSATAEEIKAELDKLKAQLGSDGTAAASVNLLGILEAKDVQIAALTAQAGQPDPAKFAPVTALTALTEENTALKTKVAELEQQSGTAALSAQITAALADGRVNKSLEGWVRQLATSNPDAARAYLDKAAPIAALSSMQTSKLDSKPLPGAQGVAALTAEEKEVAKLLGMSEDAYVKGKETK